MGSVRANVMKQFYTALERFEGGPEVLMRIPDSRRAKVLAASRVEWLPIDYNYEATELLTEIHGISRSEEFFRHLWSGLFESPVFRPMLTGLRAIGGNDPGTYLRHTPRGYALVFRDVGRIEILDRSDRHLEMEMVDLPTECFREFNPWARYTAAIFGITYDLCGRRGHSHVTEENATAGFAKIMFEW